MFRRMIGRAWETGLIQARQYYSIAPASGHSGQVWRYLSPGKKRSHSAGLKLRPAAWQAPSIKSSIFKRQKRSRPSSPPSTNQRLSAVMAMVLAWQKDGLSGRVFSPQIPHAGRVAQKNIAGRHP